MYTLSRLKLCGSQVKLWRSKNSTAIGLAFQRQTHYAGSWKEHRRIQNPEIAKNIPINEYVKEGKTKKTRQVLVCGLGAVGSLGLPKFYRPDKSKVEDFKKRSQALQATFKRIPRLKPSDKIFDIACGYGFTVIAAKLDNSSHSVVGFGLNTHSQLGFQSSRPGIPLEIVSEPMPIWLPTDDKIKSVGCGRSHTLCLSEEGAVYSLGNNSFGQCGRAIVEDEEYFGSKRVQKIESLPEDIDQVVCGQDNSFFITKKGSLYSCGWSADGQTGLGHFKTQWEPQQVKGDLQYSQIVKVSASADTVLALSEEGNVFGWGNSEYSQFRRMLNDESEQFTSPRFLNLENDIPGKIVDIAAGGTMCAVLNDVGQVFVWGFGLLGKGPKVEHSSQPTLIPESLFGMNAYNPDTKVVKIFAGISQMAAITNMGDLFAWGRNRACSLGLSHGQPQWFPMQVDMNLSHVKKIAMGVDHSCAIVEKVF